MYAVPEAVHAWAKDGAASASPAIHADTSQPATDADTNQPLPQRQSQRSSQQPNVPYVNGYALGTSQAYQAHVKSGALYPHIANSGYSDSPASSNHWQAPPANPPDALSQLIGHHGWTKSDIHPAQRPADFQPAQPQGDIQPAQQQADIRPAQRQTDVHPAQRQADVHPAQRQADIHPAQRQTDVHPAQRQADLHLAQRPAPSARDQLSAASQGLPSYALSAYYKQPHAQPPGPGYPGHAQHRHQGSTAPNARLTSSLQSLDLAHDSWHNLRLGQEQRLNRGGRPTAHGTATQPPSARVSPERPRDTCSDTGAHPHAGLGQRSHRQSVGMRQPAYPLQQQHLPSGQYSGGHARHRDNRHTQGGLSYDASEAAMLASAAQLSGAYHDPRSTMPAWQKPAPLRTRDSAAATDLERLVQQLTPVLSEEEHNAGKLTLVSHSLMVTTPQQAVLSTVHSMIPTLMASKLLQYVLCSTAELALNAPYWLQQDCHPLFGFKATVSL